MPHLIRRRKEPCSNGTRYPNRHSW